MLKSKKQKLVSVNVDLECPVLMTMLQALGVMFVHVTGPFWVLMNSNNLIYLKLQTTSSSECMQNLVALADNPLAVLGSDAEHPIIPVSTTD